MTVTDRLNAEIAARKAADLAEATARKAADAALDARVKKLEAQMVTVLAQPVVAPNPAPADTTAPVITAVTATNITTTSATISWSLDEYATGQVQYGLTTAYGFFSTKETSFAYNAHIQTLGSLTPGTTYYYRVISADASGNTATSTQRTFQTTPLVATGTRPPIVPMIYSAGNTDTRPGYLSTITDTTYQTEVMRISNYHLRRNVYVAQVSFSKDGSRLMFFPALGSAPDYTQVIRILNGITFADIGAMAGGADRAQWSNLTNGLIYGTQDAAGEIRTNGGGVGEAWATYATIPGYGFVSFNYGMLSKNDHVGLLCNTLSNQTGSWRVIAYDLPNKQILGYEDVTWVTPSSAQISLDGDYIQIVGQNNTQEWMYAVPGSNTVMTAMSGGSYGTGAGSGGLIRNNASHMVMAELADGTPVSVSLSSGGEIRRCDNNVSRALFPGAPTAYNSGAGGHLSYTNRNFPGWVLASSGVQSAYRGNDAIVAVNLDDPTQNMTFAEAHACRIVSAASNDATPFAISNRDMTVVVFGSAWDGNEATQVYAFAAGMNVVP